MQIWFNHVPRRLSLIGIWIGKGIRLMAWKNLNTPQTNSLHFPSNAQRCLYCTSRAKEAAKFKPQLSETSLAPLHPFPGGAPSVSPPPRRSILPAKWASNPTEHLHHIYLFSGEEYKYKLAIKLPAQFRLCCHEAPSAWYKLAGFN